jgi:hypothetical protein
MSLLNPISRFRNLNPTAGRLYIATVIEHKGDGQSIVESDDGNLTVVNGQLVDVGNRAIISRGTITGTAAQLPAVDIELF